MHSRKHGGPIQPGMEQWEGGGSLRESERSDFVRSTMTCIWDHGMDKKECEWSPLRRRSPQDRFNSHSSCVSSIQGPSAFFSFFDFGALISLRAVCGHERGLMHLNECGTMILRTGQM